MKVTRRQLLFLSGSAYLAWRAPLHSSSGSVAGPLQLSGAEGSVVTTFSQSFDTLYELTVPATISFSSARDIVRATVVYDRRVFEPASRVAVQIKGKWTSVPGAVVDIDEKMSTLEFSFDPKGSLSSVATPLTHRELYPAENIGKVEPILVSARMGDSQDALLNFDSHPTERPVAVWGAEVFAMWALLPIRLNGREEHYSFPAGVLVRSTGPTPVPAGAALTIDVDPSLISEIRVRENPMRKGPPNVQLVAQTPGRYTLRLPDEIPATDSAWVELVSTGTEGANVDGMTFARVSFSADALGTVSRQTGRTSSSDLTSSGRPTRPVESVQPPWAEGALG